MGTWTGIVHVEPGVMQVLEVLASPANEVVPREKILAEGEAVTA